MKRKLTVLSLLLLSAGCGGNIAKATTSDVATRVQFLDVNRPDGTTMQCLTIGVPGESGFAIDCDWRGDWLGGK